MTQQDTHVSLAHGNGGRYMRELINELFARNWSQRGATGQIELTNEPISVPKGRKHLH